MGTSLRACSKGIRTYKFCNSLRKLDLGCEVVLGSASLQGYGGSYVTIVESDVTGVSAFPKLVVTDVTVLCNLAVTDVIASFVSVVVDAVSPLEPPASPLDGSQSSSIMIGE